MATRASACASSPARPTAGRRSRARWLVLGYDYTPEEVRRVLDGAPDDLDAERRLLELYADVRTLNRPHAGGLDDDDELGSPQSTCTPSCARSTPRPNCPTATWST